MQRNWNLLILAGVAVVLALVLVGSLPAMARQKHMENALSALEQAKNELEKASRDKGGHRENAIKLINDAMKEVRRGIEYDDTHSSKDEDRGSGKHTRQVNLDDLEGMKARNLDSTMSERGFRNKGGYKQGSVSFTTWWNANTNQCVSVETREGRVDRVEAIFEGNCK